MEKKYPIIFILDICIQSILIAMNAWAWILLFLSNMVTLGTYEFLFSLLFIITLYQTIFSTSLQDKIQANPMIMKRIDKHSPLVWVALLVIIIIVMIGGFFAVTLLHESEHLKSIASFFGIILMICVLIYYQLLAFYFYIISLWHYKKLS